jgi:hypothetical protein
MEKHADLKVIISTHDVSTSCPAIIIVIPWTDIDSDYKNELTDDQLKRYKIAPEELATMGRVLQSFICSGIEPLTTRKEYSSTKRSVAAPSSANCSHSATNTLSVRR